MISDMLALVFSCFQYEQWSNHATSVTKYENLIPVALQLKSHITWNDTFKTSFT